MDNNLGNAIGLREIGLHPGAAEADRQNILTLYAEKSYYDATMEP